MKEGGYSLDKFRAAQEAGREDLKPDERAFLENYRRVKKEMDTEKKGAVMWGGPAGGSGISLLASMLTDVIKRDRREVLFNSKKAKGLEDKDSGTVAGQLEMAHEEAELLNKEYDRRAEAIRKATEDLEDFVKHLNGRVKNNE